MKTLACMTKSAHAPALDALLASLGAVRGAGGDWLLDCGQTSETVIIVVLPAASEADLETTVSTAALTGRRVVGLWPPGAPTELPAALRDYGGSAVIWSAEALRAVICEEQVVWQDPGGGERAPQNPKRNEC